MRGTVEHARQQMAEAIELHLDLLCKSGEPIPAPATSDQFSVDQDGDDELCTWVEMDAARAVVG